MHQLASIATVVSALLLVVLRAEASIDIALQMQLGNPSTASADTNNHDHYLIQRPVEAIDYSDNLGELGLDRERHGHEFTLPQLLHRHEFAAEFLLGKDRRLHRFGL